MFAVMFAGRALPMRSNAVASAAVRTDFVAPQQIPPRCAPELEALVTEYHFPERTPFRLQARFGPALLTRPTDLLASADLVHNCLFARPTVLLLYRLRRSLEHTTPLIARVLPRKQQVTGPSRQWCRSQSRAGTKRLGCSPQRCGWLLRSGQQFDPLGNHHPSWHR